MPIRGIVAAGGASQERKSLSDTIQAIVAPGRAGATVTDVNA